MDDELIGEALLDGNASDYMPKAMIEKAYEKRESGQMKRAVDKLEALTGKRVEMIAPTGAPSAQFSADQLAEAQRFAQLAAPKAKTFDLPSDPTARYHLWHQLADRLTNGEVLTDEETQWHSRYAKHPDFASIRRMFEFAEQARA